MTLKSILRAIKSGLHVASGMMDRADQLLDEERADPEVVMLTRVNDLAIAVGVLEGARLRDAKASAAMADALAHLAINTKKLAEELNHLQQEALVQVRLPCEEAARLSCKPPLSSNACFFMSSHNAKELGLPATQSIYTRVGDS